MGTYTTNFSLYKPAKNDVDYVAPFATSMDTIDTELAKVPAGSDTQVQVNDGGVLSGFAWLVIDKASQLLQSTIVKATSYFQGCLAGYKAISAGDTTPSVAGTHMLVYATASDLTIEGLDNGTDGQVVTIMNMSPNTLTITRFFYCSVASDFAMHANDTLTLACYHGTWNEISRSVNN